MTVDCLPGSSYTCLDVLFFVGVSLRGALCSLRSRRLVVQYKYDTGGSAEGRGQDRQASKKGASKQASKEPAATAMLRFGREHPLGMCGARATSSCSGGLSTPNGCPPFLLFAILEKCEPPTSYHTTVKSSPLSSPCTIVVIRHSLKDFPKGVLSPSHGSSHHAVCSRY